MSSDLVPGILRTDFFLNLVTFCIFDAILERLFFIFDRWVSRVPSFIQIKSFLVFFAAILDPPFWISEFWARTRNQWPTNLQVPNFIQTSNFAFWSAILDPPFLLSEFQIRIRNQWPQSFLSTKFHPNLLISSSAILDPPLWISEFWASTSDPKNPAYKISSQLSKFCIFVCHIRSAISNFLVLSLDS